MASDSTRPLHQLTELDRSHAVAHCSVCGPATPVRLRPGRGPECRRKGWDLYGSATARRRRLALYGLTQTEYDELLAEQGGGCAICGRQREPRRGGSLAVDHDHKDGAVRGILCSWCNRGLGMFSDDPEMLRTAATYLESAR